MITILPDETFLRWFDALEERHLADLTFSEVRRGVEALSATWVEGRRTRLASALAGAGKRAAFALFYAPLHYLLIQAILEASGAATHRVGTILDLGCGTGVAGAAWALEAQGHPRVTGIEPNGWAAEEARWTWRTLGIHGTVRRTDIGRVRLPGCAAGIVVAFTANELEETARARLRDNLIAAAGRGAQVLVVEPIARKLVPWWKDWATRFEAVGGQAMEWRFRPNLPERLRLMDRAAGLDHRFLTGRSLWLKRSGG